VTDGWANKVNYEHFLYLDLYYFASNRLESLGNKKVSATGTVSNIRPFGKGDGKDYHKSEPKDAKKEELDAYLEAYLNEAKTVKLVDVETVAENKVIQARQDKTIGKELLFARKETSDETKPIKEAEIKKYIAWYGPVFTEFSVDKETLDGYMVAREKNDVMGIPKATGKTSNDNKENQSKVPLIILLLGWVEEKTEGDKKIPAHWIGKTLYKPSTPEPTTEGSNEKDYNGRIVRIAIGSETTKGHITDQTSYIIFSLTTEKIPEPGPKPKPDASFGVIPSMLITILSSLIYFIMM